MPYGAALGSAMVPHAVGTSRRPSLAATAGSHRATGNCLPRIWLLSVHGSGHVPQTTLTDSEANLSPLSPDHFGDATTATSRRNPPWAFDELVLALDLYLREGQLDDSHARVVELSSCSTTYRSTPFARTWSGSATRTALH